MPIYEYVCNACHKQFEIVESLREHDKPEHAKCPGCSSTDVERHLSPVFVETEKKS